MAVLINGNGNKAIYANQDADLIASLVGDQSCISAVGSQMAATAQDANTIAIADGVCITKEGRRIQLDNGRTDIFEIPTGESGVTNYYIIGYHLYTEADSSQKCETFVQKMANSTATITEDTFRGGATDVYVSLYRVTQVGFNISTIDALLVSLANLEGLKSALPLTHSHREMSNGRTCAQIFGALATVFNSLTEREKIGAKLIHGNTASVNRGVFSLRGCNAQGGIFSTSECAYNGNDIYIIGGTEVSISTNSTECYQAVDKVSVLTTSPYTVQSYAGAKIEAADVIGSASDTHYYELVW